jgi:diguanylate cyclase (GGDEF)-like protein
VWWEDGVRHVSSVADETNLELCARPSLYERALQTAQLTNTRAVDLPDDELRAYAATHKFRNVWVAPVVGTHGEPPLGVIVGWTGLDLDLELRPQMHLTAGLELLRLALHDDRRRRQLHTMAATDQLTQVPNRLGLENALHAAREKQCYPLAALFVDLDDFKVVNSRFGHDGGDAVLAEIGRRLRAYGAHDHAVARLGGDEFVIMCDASPGHTALVGRAQSLLELLAEPIGVDGGTVTVGASIGIAVARNDEELRGTLRRADGALFQAKRAGKATAVLADPA